VDGEVEVDGEAEAEADGEADADGEVEAEVDVQVASRQLARRRSPRRREPHEPEQQVTAARAPREAEADLVAHDERGRVDRRTRRERHRHRAHHTRDGVVRDPHEATVGHEAHHTPVALVHLLRPDALRSRAASPGRRCEQRREHRAARQHQTP
jgi:hypothetical protein